MRYASVEEKEKEIMANTNPTKDAPQPGVAVPDQMGDTKDEKTQTEKLRQPNERDGSPDNGKTGTDRKTDVDQREVSQAHEDVERGLIDTDRRGVPDDVPDSRDNKGV
jgi:hypothetical protein